MVDEAALRRTVSEYASTLLGSYHIGEVLDRLVTQVVEVLGVCGAGVTIGDEDGLLPFVAASDEQVLRVEREQIESAEGPCQDAFHSGKQVTCNDLTTEQRWPQYRETALAEGCRAVAGIPMVVADRVVGAMNLYDNRPHEWSADTLAAARLLSDFASGYVINQQTLNDSQRLAAQLESALESRVVIEQAKGALAERRGIGVAEAFRLLRRHARTTNARLHDVARDVVDRELEV